MTTAPPEAVPPDGTRPGPAPRLPGALRLDRGTLLLGLMVLLLVGPGLLPGRIFGYGDWLTYYLPLRDHLASAWRAGELLPLWWPDVLNGYPVGANPQYGLFYPPHLLLAVLPLGTALALLAGLHLFWGGLGMRVLLRERGADPAAALLGGVVYLAAGPALAAASTVTTTLALAWLPWVLHSFPAGLEAGAVGRRLRAALALALMFLSGGLEVLLWTVLLLPFWTLASWRVYLGEGPGFGLKPSWARRLGPLVPGLLVIGGLALLLSAIQLLPFLELVGHSTRSAAMDPGLARFTAGPGRLLALLFPWAGWDPVGLTSWLEPTGQVRAHYLPSLFFGITVLVLAVHGVRGSPASERRVLGVALLLALLFGLGSGLPGVERLEGLVPGSTFYRYPEKYLLLLVPGSAWFATWGLDRRLSARRIMSLPGDRPAGPTGRLLTLLAALSGLAALVLLLPGEGPARWLLRLQGLTADRGSIDRYVLWQAGGLVLTAGVALAVRHLLWPGVQRADRPGRGPARRAPWVVACLVAAELLAAGWGFFAAGPLAPLYEERPLARTIRMRSEDNPGRRTHRWIPFQQERAPASLLAHPRDQRLLYQAWLVPNLSVLQGISSFDGLAALRVTEQALAENTWRTLPDAERIPMARVLGIRWLIVTDAQLVRQLSLNEVAEPTFTSTPYRYALEPRIPSLWLYDTHAPAAVRVVHDWETAPDAATAFTEIRERAGDPERRVVLTLGADGRGAEPVNLFGPPPREWAEDAPPARVETLSDSGDRLLFRVTSERPGLLLVAGTPYPGWRAEVDGHDQPIWTADLAHRAIPIPARTSEVRLTFLPPTFLWGAAASLVGLLILIASFLRKRLRTSRQRQEIG